ncbi:uncharacterized protein Z518_07388 [Rhinocladiella mackenziei CBS 650.93]|uniref:Uncharacterized protein n=1 Tax=Rhinocladiella mackenziei CBS 650.93 TaxID=1442369 RepID=A0A0D2J496_9EURO|nr:uncharacterized protein Z518_07388 [Rhinocladiella mackenziei CBS 650.93]KIX03835.1 hypothetical protein Z518_07388 [Rhinocladiella mackenziei CBS 650.93]
MSSASSSPASEVKASLPKFDGPLLCPSGTSDVARRQAWLASSAAKETIVHGPPDVGHLLAAKDGIGTKSSWFVLRERDDSAPGRVER